jgi:hypothetical protein
MQPVKICNRHMVIFGEGCQPSLAVLTLWRPTGSHEARAVIIVPVKSRLTKDSHCTFLRLLPHIEKCSSADICDIGVLTRSFVFSSFYAANAMQPQASVTQIGQVARRHVLHTHTHMTLKSFVQPATA